MKLFRVVTEREGKTIKAQGVVETEIKQVTRYYAAENMETVWKQAVELADDEHLLAVIEENPSITIL